MTYYKYILNSKYIKNDNEKIYTGLVALFCIKLKRDIMLDPYCKKNERFVKKYYCLHDKCTCGCKQIIGKHILLIKIIINNEN